MGGRPPSAEYAGFALYLGASATAVVYLLWAALPTAWLEQGLGIEYYPSRWWALAVPAFVLMMMLYIYVALAAYNTERLTYDPSAVETVTDTDAQVAPATKELLFGPSNAVLDLPLAAVCETLYR